MQDQPTCLNCGSEVTGRYCADCGQSVCEPRGPLLGVLRELFGTVFDVDSRLLRSMGILLSRPGELTLRYLAGKRASLLSPGRMYLVLSLILFLFIDIPVPDARRTNLYVGGQLVGREAADPELGEMKLDFSTALPWLSSVVEDKQEELRQMDPQRLLGEIFGGLEGSLSNALILFIPLLAFVLKVLFRGSRRLYYDHVIFSLHFQSFLFLLIVVCWTLSRLSPMTFLALLATPAYLGLAMRRVYGGSWPRTVVKLAVLLASYVFILGVVVAGTLNYIIWRI